MKKEILAVKRENLFGKNNRAYFTGFELLEDARDSGLERNIELFAEYFLEENLENNPDYKQIITYGALFHEDDHGRRDKIFSYRRVGGDMRLRDKWSIGIGGHVHHLERLNERVIKSNLTRNINREINAMPYMEELYLKGYINCDDCPLNKDHLALLYFGKIHDISEIRTLSLDLEDGKFRTPEEIQQLIQEKKLEEWSEIAYDVLMKKN